MAANQSAQTPGLNFGGFGSTQSMGEIVTAQYVAVDANNVTRRK